MRRSFHRLHCIFLVLEQVLEEKGEDRVRFSLRIQDFPWLMQEVCIVAVALDVSCLQFLLEHVVSHEADGIVQVIEVHCFGLRLLHELQDLQQSALVPAHHELRSQASQLFLEACQAAMQPPAVVRAWLEESFLFWRPHEQRQHRTSGRMRGRKSRVVVGAQVATQPHDGNHARAQLEEVHARARRNDASTTMSERPTRTRIETSTKRYR